MTAAEDSRRARRRRKQTASRQAPTISLASASPRRQELLRLTGWPAIVRPVDVDEMERPQESAVELASRLASHKARRCLEQGGGPLILAADTVVALGGMLLGKPADPGQAVAMLRNLAGRTHQVATAIALIDSRSGTELLDVCLTDVPMRPYSEAEIRQYVGGGSPFDKAGGYGIQDRSFAPVAVDRLAGCYANVMGLPLCHLTRTMRRLGHVPPADVPAVCQAETGYDCPVFAQVLAEAV